MTTPRQLSEEELKRIQSNSDSHYTYDGLADSDIARLLRHISFLTARIEELENENTTLQRRYDLIDASEKAMIGKLKVSEAGKNLAASEMTNARKERDELWHERNKLRDELTSQRSANTALVKENNAIRGLFNAEGDKDRLQLLLQFLTRAEQAEAKLAELRKELNKG